MQLPPMLRSVQHQQQQQLLRQQQIQQEEEKQISLSDMGYDLIDMAGNQLKKVAPYINKTLEWGWFPLVIAIGLKQGTHKFYPSDGANVPEDMRDVPMERNASWTDAIPLVGSHGSSKSGILPSF